MKPGGKFSLVDHHGHGVTDETYRGKYALIFFGFTHCKVVCPRALGKLTSVLDALGPLATKITPLYVTVDPERDSPEVMRKFLDRNYPKFIGLTGSPDQIEQAKKTFRVFARRTPDPADPQEYTVPHTAITYVLGPDGRYATHFTDAIDERQMIEGLSALIERS